MFLLKGIYEISFTLLVLCTFSLVVQFSRTVPLSSSAAFRLRSPLEERSLSISLPSLFVNPLFSIFSNFSFFGLCPSKLLFFSFFPPLLPSFSSKIHLSPFFAFFSSTFLFLLSPFFLPLFPPLPTPPFQKTDLPHPGRSVVCKNLFSAFFNKRLRPSAPVPGKAPQTAHKKPGLSACRWRIFQFLPWR